MPEPSPEETFSQGPSEVIGAVRGFDDISTDPGVIAANLAIAGATVWVLFTTVLLNAVLQDNRSEVERRTAWLTRPFRWLRRRATGSLRRRGSLRASRARAVASAVLVLAGTGVVYGALEPGFGLNRATAVLFAGVVAGVGLVTYACSGFEAWATTRVTGAPAAVRPFPACIAIAVCSVVVSRLLDFQPGVMYGFVASCALLSPAEPDDHAKGRIAVAPVAATLLLTVGFWLAVSPIRSLDGGSGSWLAEVLEAVAVIVFVGGIESLFLGMIPIAATDGGKVYRWHRGLWVVLTVIAAFLVWHVLLGRERAYFSGLRETGSITVVAMFVAYSAATVGLWAYFRFRRSEMAERGVVAPVAEVRVEGPRASKVPTKAAQTKKAEASSRRQRPE